MKDVGENLLIIHVDSDNVHQFSWTSFQLLSHVVRSLNLTVSVSCQTSITASSTKCSCNNPAHAAQFISYRDLRPGFNSIHVL